ncbi:trypco2 family protein [Rhizobium laguerreae]|uniref:trypco2 family protein n=1 Tax=Rhizobium laguerreae TaxID=1076926 RepID=UPI0014426C06|nr:trypco2 family protein [Rhizobium laguerreae]NKN15512.1 hypothetical protein [Rhizobium laguerreae]
MESVSLSDLIQELKAQLKHAQSMDGEKIFELAEATITVKVAVKTSASADGKLELYVVSAGVAGQNDNEQSHEITIKLKAGDILLGDDN